MGKYVVGMGEILWDMLPEGKKPGGAPANFAYHVSQFGLPGCVVSAVGHDALGREVVEMLADKGLPHRIVTIGYPTGTVRIEVDNLGVPQYDITENVAWDNIPFTPELESLARQTVAVCFGSLAQRSAVSRDTIGRFLNAMPVTDGTLIVFDVNLRQNFYSREILDRSMTRCNILKINDEELDILAEMFGLSGTYTDRCRALLEKYALKTLILTCGTDGSYVFTHGDVSFRTTPLVEVADTVGAGDSFTAAFVSCILKGKSVADAHSTAVLTSAFVCTCNGAMPCLPEHLLI